MKWMTTLLVLAVIPGVAPPAAQVTLSTRARALQPGEIVELTVATATPAASMAVRAFDRDVAAWRVDASTWRALIGIDLDVSPGRHPVVARTASGARAELTLDVRDKAFPTRRLTVAPSFVDPPAEVQARITREAVRLNAIYDTVTPEPAWTGPFVRPVPHEANSAFGSRSIFNGQPRSPHSGADFLSPAGTPIAAPAAGRVALAGDLYYTGGTVVIDHGVGLISVLAHLSRVDATEDDRVQAGDIVGAVGATGRVTGAHLHWTVRLGGVRVDPLSLLDLLGTSDF